MLQCGCLVLEDFTFLCVCVCVCVQVLELLECMGLKQYQDHFKSEHISGEILAECDDDMLEKDLRVTSKLHRKRLLKIISGK